MKYTAQFSVTLNHILAPPLRSWERRLLSQQTLHIDLYKQYCCRKKYYTDNLLLKSFYGNIASVMLWGYHR